MVQSELAKSRQTVMGRHMLHLCIHFSIVQNHQKLRHDRVEENPVKYGGFAARYGGEEFVVAFPGKTVEECTRYVEEIRRGIGGLSLEYEGVLVVIHVSVGVTIPFFSALFKKRSSDTFKSPRLCSPVRPSWVAICCIFAYISALLYGTIRTCNTGGGLSASKNIGWMPEKISC